MSIRTRLYDARLQRSMGTMSRCNTSSLFGDTKLTPLEPRKKVVLVCIHLIFYSYPMFDTRETNI